MKKFFEKFFTVITLIVVISTCSLSVSAATTSASVTLTSSDKVVYSSAISAKATKIKVYNASSSSHRVYGYIEYKSGDNYVKDCHTLVSPGDTNTLKSSSSFSNTFKWRVELNPYGVATKSCTAEGTIYSR